MEMKRKDPVFSVVKEIFRKHKLLLLLLAGSAAGSILGGLLPPLALEQAVDGLTHGMGVTVSAAACYFLLLALAGLFDSAKECMIALFGQKVTHGMRTAMSRKLSKLPASYFIKNEAGAVTSRFTHDVNTVETLFASGVISMAADVCKVLGILVMIFYKSTGLGIMLLAVLPLLFLMTRAVQKRMLQAQMDNRAAVARTNQHIPETIANLRTIRVFGKEDYMRRRYNEAVKRSFSAMERVNFYDAVYSPVILTVSAALIAVMMVLSVTDSSAAQFFGMSAGTVVALIAYVGAVFDPLERIGMEIQNIQSAVAGVRRIREFLQEEERTILPEQEAAFHPADWHTAVELEAVEFSYETGRAILQNFSLHIKTGETVTLSGRTGVGKSTVFKLILGLYEPDSGQVRIFGVPAHRIPDTVRRKILGHVEQNFHMIRGTVKEQISMKDPEVTDQQIQDALEMTGMWEVCRKAGLDTPCTSQLFSQGQQQLLSIARAVVSDPAILLLDEITANLDSATEAKVMEALRKASSHRTVISISHRLYQETGGRKITL